LNGRVDLEIPDDLVADDACSGGVDERVVEEDVRLRRGNRAGCVQLLAVCHVLSRCCWSRDSNDTRQRDVLDSWMSVEPPVPAVKPMMRLSGRA